MRVKIVISIIAGLLIVAHLCWPNIKPDAATLALIIAGILPWLGPIIRSIELPGGFKIELQDIRAATRKIEMGRAARSIAPPSASSHDQSLEYLRDILKTDASLALVGLRIEIERRLHFIAEKHELPEIARSAGALLNELTKRLSIDPSTSAGLRELINLGNQAAHGVKVSQDAAEWAIETSPMLLGVLDSL